MASFSDRINNGLARLVGRANSDISLDQKYPFKTEVSADVFIRLKIEGLYKRILRDCIKRSIWDHKSKEIIERSFYDCFENSENNKGLVSYIASTMFSGGTKALVWRDGVLREATKAETNLIKKDYDLVSKSNQGIIINFKDYELTKILRHYYLQLYMVNMSRTTAVNVSASLKLQISNLREMINKADADSAIKQARAIVDALRNGDPVLLDANDRVEAMSSVNTDPLVVARDEIYSEITQETGLPFAYISGVATTGASVIGDADINRESEAIEPYFLSIWKPILTNLYGIKQVEYRQEKWRALESKVRTVATLEALDSLTPDEIREFATRILEIKDGSQSKEK